MLRSLASRSRFGRSIDSTRRKNRSRRRFRRLAAEALEARSLLATVSFSNVYVEAEVVDLTTGELEDVTLRGTAAITTDDGSGDTNGNGRQEKQSAIDD